MGDPTPGPSTHRFLLGQKITIHTPGRAFHGMQGEIVRLTWANTPGVPYYRVKPLGKDYDTGLYESEVRPS